MLIVAFSLLTFFFLTLEPSTVHFFLYMRQLLYCCPPRIAPLTVGKIVLDYLQIE